jgi:hypothetical protein
MGVATVHSRTSTIPPSEVIPGVPEGGAARVCSALTPAEGDGRCYTLTPSDAAEGLGVPGICKTYADVERELRDLLRSNFLPLLVDGVVERFSDW